MPRRLLSGASHRRFRSALSQHLGRIDGERSPRRHDRGRFRRVRTLRSAFRLESDCAPPRSLPPRRLRRAELFRETRHAAHARRSQSPQLPTVAGSGLSYYRVWHLTAADYGAELLAGRKLAHQQRGGAQNGGPCRTRPGVSATFIIGDALELGRLVTVLDDYLLPPLIVRALYPHNRHLSAKVRAFVDFLAARFEESRPGTAGVKLPASPPHCRSVPQRDDRKLDRRPVVLARKIRADDPSEPRRVSRRPVLFEARRQYRSAQGHNRRPRPRARGRFPIGSRRRRLLNQSSHSRVRARSTSIDAPGASGDRSPRPCRGR